MPDLFVSGARISARMVGVGDGPVRLSLGIEDPADILADLAGALETV
jgi:O-acetylhomoserine/O-acetylserine sulfhydrylase-like pyridoxal-dependent enzyme